MGCHSPSAFHAPQLFVTLTGFPSDQGLSASAAACRNYCWWQFKMFMNEALPL